MSDIDPKAAQHRRAVETEDWDRVRELELELIGPSDNTERPEDGPQPTQDPNGDLEDLDAGTAGPAPGSEDDAARTTSEEGRSDA
jgi:hypothetical protein